MRKDDEDWMKKKCIELKAEDQLEDEDGHG